jgi:HD superfamily phosphohydrolase
MLKLIKDPVVGNTVLSEIEAGILEMPVVNRLHHLMQNGLAYRVFPSDTTSRFEHSIGVMHLAGEMYCRGLANALPKTRDRFLQKAWRTVLAPAQGLADGPDALLGDSHRLPDVTAEVLGPEFLNHHPGPNLSCRVPHLRAAHTLLLQAVRLAGLLHDVGHFPCSHLFEDALRLLACHGLPRDLKDSLEKIDLTTSQQAPALKNTALHEQAGFLIARAVLYERMVKGGRITPLKDAVVKRVILATLRILGHKNDRLTPKSITFALSELLCGDLDADRLDFILRDGRRTGLVTASGDVDRILKMMCLTEDKKGFRFCPAVQTLNDVQQCLLDRLRLYQYVYSHHRVWRLENQLKYAIRIMLNSPGEIREELTALFDDLKSLGGDLKPALLKDTLYRIARRTDSWLLGLVQTARESIMSPEDKEKTEELFSGAKNWTSLWKREFEYRDFLIQAAQTWLKKEAGFIRHLHAVYQQIPPQKDGLAREYQRNLAKLAALEINAKEDLDENTLAWLGSLGVRAVLTQAESRLICKHNIPNAMICPTRFHPGVHNLCLADIKSDERPRRKFAQLSATMRYFHRICERGIALHVFVRKESDQVAVTKAVAAAVFTILTSMLSKDETSEATSKSEPCDL